MKAMKLIGISAFLAYYVIFWMPNLANAIDFYSNFGGKIQSSTNCWCSAPGAWKLTFSPLASPVGATLGYLSWPWVFTEVYSYGNVDPGKIVLGKAILIPYPCVTFKVTIVPPFFKCDPAGAPLPIIKIGTQ
ncbi:hypothetical protein KGQ24_02320 [Patescibacteria group bacterium]|nr:hypothetical protein [Patescibacteria group bacterium]